uniref:Uncharacterized protein n=1 Tax=Siphoviridae sp. ctDtx1 TaxID=2825391 RepID=A0A8S5PS60_9CAUD|nr:MAG TPA: hypothetical protein [Siphoviridae sp. ctDtx1]
MEDKMILLMKFTEEKYIKDLQEGKLYCKNLKHYRELENKDGDRDMGDKNEGKFLLNEVKCDFYSREDEKLVLTVQNANVSLDIYGVDKTPVFCMTGVKESDLKEFYDNEKEGYILNFAELLNDMLDKSYWEAAVVITKPGEFYNRIIKKCMKDKINITARSVKYTDFKINYTDRTNSFVKDKKEIVFWKDHYYKGQYEYRIAVDNVKVDDYYQFDIGDISDITRVYRKEELLDFLNTEYLIKIE